MIKQITSLIVLSGFFLNSFVAGQTIESYQKLDITNTSGQILDAINSEYKSKNPAEFNDLVKRETPKFLTEQNAELFPQEFNRILEANAAEQKSSQFLRKSSAELLKYGVAVGANYSEIIVGKHLGNFLIPAAQQAVELKTSQWIGEKIEADRAARDKIIEQRLTLFFAKGIDDVTTDDAQVFENVFAVSRADIPALNKNDYSLFNKVMIRQAFEFIKNNRNQLTELKRSIELRTAEQKEADFARVKSEYTAAIGAMELRVTDEVKAEFAGAGKIFDKLTENQTKIFETLGHLQSEVKSSQKDIKTIETRVLELKRKIMEVGKDVSQVQSEILELKTKQNEHSKLTAQNSLKLDIVSKYVFMGLTPAQQLAGLDNKHFDNIFDKVEKEKLEKQLTSIVTAETVVSFSKNVTEGAQTTVSALVKTGILKKKDAERANKLVGQIVSLSQIVSGAARIGAQDYTGAFSVVQGLGGLFGRVQKAQPSPEFQLLQQMYQEMSQRLGAIDKRLGAIEESVINFRKDVIEMYKSLSSSLQNIASELERINWKLDNIQKLTATLFQRDYAMCPSVEGKTGPDNIINANNKLDSYSKYQDFYTNDALPQCLRALNDFSMTPENAIFQMGTLEGENQQVENQVTRIYNPTRALFLKYYGINNNLAKASLMFSSETTNNSNKAMSELIKPRYKTGNAEGIVVPPLENSLDHYLNYEMVSQFTKYFLTYSPYFEISWDDQNFKPDQLDVYLERSGDAKFQKRRYMNQRLENLITLTDYAIAQQSLLAGSSLIDPAFAIIFTANQKEADIKLVNAALRENKLFAYNFATHLLNKGLRISENPIKFNEFRNIVAEINSTEAATAEQIASLNNLVHFVVFKFKEDKKLYISYDRAGETIDLAVPEPSVVLEDRMINSEAIPILLKTRRALLEKHFDQNFTGKFAGQSDGKFTKDHFKYFYASAYSGGESTSNPVVSK